MRDPRRMAKRRCAKRRENERNLERVCGSSRSRYLCRFSGGPRSGAATTPGTPGRHFFFLSLSFCGGGGAGLTGGRTTGGGAGGRAVGVTGAGCVLGGTTWKRG